MQVFVGALLIVGGTFVAFVGGFLTGSGTNVVVGPLLIVTGVALAATGGMVLSG